jgi:predicted NBD/HSP70 family sugar kinase
VVLEGRSLAGLGIEINVDYAAVTAIDLAGRELFFEERPVTGVAPRLSDVVGVIRDAVARLAGADVELLGLTIAVPGLIDRGRGVVVDAPNLGWSEVALVEEVRRGLDGGVSVAVDNDANCAARAERVHGVAVGVDDFVYLTGTVGLGAGIFSGGQVLRGSRGLAGEVGHLRVGDETFVCACGRTGCWEAMVGLRALEQQTGVAVEPGEDPVSYAERLRRSPEAGEALTGIGQALGRGVAQLAVTLDPRMVVLGGAFVPLGDVLVREVETALDASFTGNGCTVALSTLGLHAASVGAALDALDEVYAGRRSLPG